MKKFFFSISFLSLPFLGIAHEGHGLADGSSLLHYLTAPEHLFPALAGLLILLGTLGWHGYHRLKAIKEKKR